MGRRMVTSPRSFIRLTIFCFILALLLLWLSPPLSSRHTERAQGHEHEHEHEYHQQSPHGVAPPSLIATKTDKERLNLAVKLQTLKALLEERFVVDHWRYGRRYNAPALDRLTQCTLDGTCGPGENTVIILASFHFGNARSGHVSGEDIWAHSTITAFEALNYTMLYTYGAMDTLNIYQTIPDLIPIIIFEGSSLDDCIKRTKETADETDYDHTPGTWQRADRVGCIRRKGFEEGIPIWKSFAFHFWGGPATPMGSNWTLSPENWELWQPGRGNNYLGYSIEDRCSQIDVQKERDHRALILAKNVDMLGNKDFAWTGLLADVVASIPKSKEGKPFELVSTAGRSAAEGGPDQLPEPGVTSLGRMPQMQWWAEVAKGKAMLGIGRPYLSPSPYDAMCFGVPFINVIFGRDEKDPKNKAKWWTMHDALIPIDPPYVYHVKQHDAEELKEALKQAIAHPIGRYIPPWMTLESVKERHKKLVETDWLPIAEEYVAQKWQNEEPPFLL